MGLSRINGINYREIDNFNYSVIKYKNLLYECNRQKDAFAVCLIDISNFKNYNYIYGYGFGNSILNKVYMKINSCIAQNGYVVRFGGDIFMVILNKIDMKDHVIKIVTKIENVLKNSLLIGETQIKILVNIGISLYPQDSENVEDILKCTEIALNYSRKKDLYSHCFFNEKMRQLVLRSAIIRQDLLNSEYENEFTAYYQPEYDSKTMKIVGAEALLRWETNSKGIVQGKDFINIAIESGIIKDIGRVLIKKVSKQLKEIYKEGHGDMTISINMSEKQLTEKNFFQFFKTIFIESEVHHNSIIIEIPEKMLNNLDNKILSVITQLRSSGIKIFLDDFGDQYSSINHLTKLPIDGIKVDAKLIYEEEQEEKGKLVFENIMKMANQLGIEVWAKGIQKKSQLKYFSRMGCKRLQGYILSKPLDREDLMKIL